jgi:uncharacterized damage-inducible protein DinB
LFVRSSVKLLGDVETAGLGADIISDMSELQEKIATEFREQSCVRLTEMVNQLESCVGTLSDEQVWQRGGEHENAIGNLILHLCGNMRQWVLHGIKGDKDVRVRDAEFACQGGQSGKELMDQFRAVTTEVLQVIRALPTERLMEWVEPQPGRPGKTILGSMYQVVAHAHVHIGQAIVLTKQMAGQDLDLTIPRKR